jgi:hypothetical protein
MVNSGDLGSLRRKRPHEGERPILVDSEMGDRFYLAGEGLWVFRNLTAEAQYREDLRRVN